MKDLTQGSITKHLLHLSAYLSVTIVSISLYHLADLYWVGRLGEEAIAALALAGNLMFVVIAVGQVLGVGVSTLVSHATGAKDQTQVRLIFNQGLVFSTLAGLGIVLLGFAVRPYYFGWLGANARTSELGQDYLFWFLLAFQIQLIGMAFGGALRGVGDVKTPMVINGFAVLLNMVLDPVLIFGWGPVPELGVAGASLATLVAALTAGIFLIWYFSRSRSYLRFVPSQWRPRWNLLQRVLSIGAPAGAQFGLLAVFLMLAFLVIGRFGTSAQAGFGVGQRVMMSIMLPVLAIAFATAPLVGQNFGARRPDRVRQTFYSALTLAVGVAIALTLLCQIVPEWFIRLFSREPSVVAFGAEYLRVVAWHFVASAVVHITTSVFQGLGNTVPPLSSAAVRLAAFAVPVVLLAQMPGFQFRHVWYLSVGCVFLQALLNLYLLKREFRRRAQFFQPATLLAQEPASD